MKHVNGLTHLACGVVMGWGLWHWGGWPGLCLCLGCNVATMFTNLVLKEVES